MGPRAPERTPGLRGLQDEVARRDGSCLLEKSFFFSVELPGRAADLGSIPKYRYFICNQTAEARFFTWYGFYRRPRLVSRD
jgi:hypothetical protein